MKIIRCYLKKTTVYSSSNIACHEVAESSIKSHNVHVGEIA